MGCNIFSSVFLLERSHLTDENILTFSYVFNLEAS